MNHTLIHVRMPHFRKRELNKMAGSFVEIPVSISRDNCNVLKIQKQGFSQTISNDKLFQERGGGYHFQEKSKLTLNRRISW